MFNLLLAINLAFCNEDLPTVRSMLRIILRMLECYSVNQAELDTWLRTLPKPLVFLGINGGIPAIPSFHVGKLNGMLEEVPIDWPPYMKKLCDEIKLLSYSLPEAAIVEGTSETSSVDNSVPAVGGGGGGVD